MLGEHLKIQSRVNSDYTDEQLLLIKEMGIKYVYVIFSDEDSNYESVMRFMDRLDKFGLTCTDAGNVGIYKSPAIHLGLPGRDEGLQRRNARSLPRPCGFYERIPGKTQINGGMNDENTCKR